MNGFLNSNSLLVLGMGNALDTQQRLQLALAAGQIPAGNMAGVLFLKRPIDDLVAAQSELSTVKSTLSQVQAELASLRRTLRMQLPSSVGGLKLKVAEAVNPKWVLRENPDNLLTFASPTDQEEVEIRVDRSKGGLAQIAMTADGFTRRLELNVINVSTPSPP